MKNFSLIIAFFAILSLIFPALSQDTSAGIKEESLSLIKDLRAYNVHTYKEDILKRVPPALKFIEANKGDVTNMNFVIDVAERTLVTACDGGDYKIATPAADYLLSVVSPSKHEWRKANTRLNAINYKALGLADEGKFKEALALFNEFKSYDSTIMPHFQRSILTEKMVGIILSEGNPDGALALVEEEMKRFEGDEYSTKEHHRFQSIEAMKILKKIHRYDDAFKYALQKGNKPEALKLVSEGLYGDVEEGKKLAREIISNEEEPIAQRVVAWDWLYGRDKAFSSKWLPALIVSSKQNILANIRNMLSYKITRGNFQNVYGMETPAYFSNYDETIRIWNDYLTLSTLTKQKVGFKEAQYAVVAFGAKGEFASAVEAAEIGLENEKLLPEEIYELELAKRTLTLTGTMEEILPKIKDVDNEIGKSIEPGKRLQNLDRIGAIAVSSKNDALARAFVAYRAEVKPDPVKKVYNVKYSSTPVAGAHNWNKLSIKPEKQLLDRHFGGGDMSFMLTDVSTGDRGNATKRNDKVNIILQIATDEWGLHFLFTLKDPRAGEIEGGFIDAGSYECYLAPGNEQPYTCFLASTKKDDKTTLFQTTYDTAGHRRIVEKDPNRFRYETYFCDEEIVNYVGFSWDNFITLIPNKESKWEFEGVYWGSEAAAWNGTLSIHGRNTWGTLAFNISDKERAQIYRKLLFKVVADYKREKMANPRDGSNPQGGVLEFWQDTSLGDPDFYNEKILPIVEKLDKVAERVTAEISDKDVSDIIENHLSEFVSLRYTISRLRTDYVKSKL